MKRDLIRHMRRRFSAVHEGGEWIWFVNPKVAHTSMRKLTDPVAHLPWHNNWRTYWEAIIPKIDQAFLFTFVRNPWDKVVSAYHHLVQSNGQLARRFQERIGSPSFEGFVTKELANKSEAVDRHFAPQVHSFRYQGVQFCDFIGRYEYLDTDWDIVARRVGLPLRIRDHYHATDRDHYSRYYNEATKQVVADLYAEEIEALGYEFEG